MSKRRIALITLISIIAAFAVVVIVLACVKVSPQGISGGLKVDEIETVRIIKDGNFFGTDSPNVVKELNNTDKNSKELRSFVDTYNKETKYTIAYGILNNNWANKVVVKNDKLGVDAIKSVKGQMITDTQKFEYKLVVVQFKTPMNKLKRATVAKKDVEFDTLMFNVSDSGNSLNKFTFYLVDSTKFGTATVENQIRNEDGSATPAYQTYEFVGIMNGSKMNNYLNSVLNKQ